MATTKIKSANLKKLAEMALSKARRELEAAGTLDFKIALRYPDGRIEWQELPPELRPIMDDADLKSYYFSGIRALVEQEHAAAVIMVSCAWLGELTEKHDQLARENPDELKRLLSEFRSLADFEAAGLATRAEAIAVTAQTPDEALMVTQIYDRVTPDRVVRDVTGRILWGKRTDTVLPQSEFYGMQKMYYAKATPKTHHAAKTKAR